MLVTILATQFVPAVVIILPFFVMFRDVGLLDTRIGLILVNLAIVMPFAIWMIKGFIDGGRQAGARDDQCIEQACQLGVLGDRPAELRELAADLRQRALLEESGE